MLELVHVPYSHEFGDGSTIKSFRSGLTAAERQQAGQYFDYGGCAAAIGPEKAENFSAFHGETYVVYRSKVSEFSYQAVRGNRGIRRIHCAVCFRCAVRFRRICRHGYFSRKSFTSAAIPGSTRRDESAMRIFTPKT